MRARCWIIESRKESTMYMRRSPFGVLLMVGLGLLLGAALFGGTEVVGSVLAAPFLVLGFMFKVLLVFLFLGLMTRWFARSAGRNQRNWRGQSRDWWPEETGRRRPGWRTPPVDADTGSDQADRFEEWHRLAHARQEVDDHTPPVED
jgi:hypothetical protein